MKAWRELARSVASEELNLLPAAPVGAWMIVAGESRLAYIAALVGFYLVPAVIFLVIVTREWSGSGWPDASTGAAVAILLALPAVGTVLKGYPGVGGVVLALGPLYLAGRRPEEKWKPWEAAAVGAACALVFLFRRWWGFWSLALALFIVVELGWKLLRSWRENQPWIGRRAARHTALASASLGIVLMALAGPRLIGIANVHFLEEFTPYREGGGLYHFLRENLAFWGALPLVTAVTGAVAWHWKGPRRPMILVTVMTVLPVTLLRVLQNPDAHHWLLCLPGGALLVAVPMARWMRSLPGFRKVALGATALHWPWLVSSRRW